MLDNHYFFLDCSELLSTSYYLVIAAAAASAAAAAAAAAIAMGALAALGCGQTLAKPAFRE